ncbi:hypothetical protein E2562_034534 [Oryza meyeriana var. granulata]|uniref:Uncharacterized protein n=1 Tax=Oryza meyeriana var. granulata TaxID=110450 RepID=A0A6G1CBM9_9ORYZ|nr:hypothetical protein E2562_034534 [Oryza meyeriana var. granulata]
MPHQDGDDARKSRRPPPFFPLVAVAATPRRRSVPMPCHADSGRQSCRPLPPPVLHLPGLAATHASATAWSVHASAALPHLHRRTPRRTAFPTRCESCQRLPPH